MKEKLKNLTAVGLTVAGIGLASYQRPPRVEGQSNPVEQAEVLDDCAVPSRIPWGNSKFDKYPRLYQDGRYSHIDIGTHGPNEDVIETIDIQGEYRLGEWQFQDVPNARETRITFLKRTDIGYVQVKGPRGLLGGDEFRILQAPSDEVIDNEARCHAERSVRPWQDGYYLGDLGLSLRLRGESEPNLVNLIQCINPPMPELGLESCDLAGYSLDWDVEIPLVEVK